VQEFNVQIGSYSADMGGAGGGQVNIVTRSGGSHFHGAIYEFLRDGALDAHSYNDMGGPVPIGKHTYFFVNYEGLRHV